MTTLTSISDLRLLLTEREAAKALALSPRKLWWLRKSGQIAHVRSGRLIRYDVLDLRAWIERQKTIATPCHN